MAIRERLLRVNAGVFAFLSATLLAVSAHLYFGVLTSNQPPFVRIMLLLAAVAALFSCVAWAWAWWLSLRNPPDPRLDVAIVVAVLSAAVSATLVSIVAIEFIPGKATPNDLKVGPEK